MLTSQRAVAADYCVPINAAFLQEVKEANSHVWEILFHLRLGSQLCAPSDETIHRWIEKLTQFRKQLSVEFALEETYGYISRAVRQHISIGIDPAECLKQHKDLYLSLTDICEQAEQAQYSGTVLRDFGTYVAAFRNFDEMLAQHEKTESEMIRSGLGLKS